MPLMIGPAFKTGTKHASEGISGHVIAPGEKGYRGRFEHARFAGPMGIGERTPDEAWKEAHDTREHLIRQGQRDKKWDDEWDRADGKTTALGLGVSAGLVGTGELARARRKRQNAKLRSQLGVVKSWSEDDPFLWHADKENGAHKVTLMGEKAKADAAVNPPRAGGLARLGRWSRTERGGLVLGGAILAGAAIPVARTIGPNAEHERLKRRVRKGERYVPTPEQAAAQEARRKAQAAEKEAKQHRPVGGIWTGKPLSETWRNHVARGQVRNAATSGLLALAAGGAVVASQRHRQTTAKRDVRHDAEVAGGGLAGAAAVDTLNTVGGQSTKAILKERRNRRGFSPVEERDWSEHKKKTLGIAAGKPVPNDDSVPQHLKSRLYRTAPKSFPDRRANQLLALKNTKAWTVGSLAAGTAGGMAWAHRRGQVQKNAGEELSRAAARAAKKGKKVLTPEEIAQRRAEAAARAASKPKAAAPVAPAAEASAPSAPTVRQRSSFLGAGQKRDLTIGVPLGAGALAYGLHTPRYKDERTKVGKRDQASRNRWQNVAAGGVATTGLAHAAEGRALKLSERELGRVVSANNADGVGEGDFHPDQPRIDRGKHARRAINHMDNVRLARGAKIGAALGTLYAGKKAVDKRDGRDNARVAAGAVGGAALLDATDTVAGAGLKRGARMQWDYARRGASEEQKTGWNNILREHGKKHGLLDPNRPSRGRIPTPSDPHSVKNRYYRSYPTAVPGARLQRLNALRDKKTGPILAAGAVLGGAGVLHRQHQEVGKANNFIVAGQLSGATGAGAYLQARRDNRHREAREIAGATVGGWAGQGVYQGAGYGYRNAVRGLNGSKVPRHELPHLDPKRDFEGDPKGAKLRDQNIRERAELKRHHPRLADAKRNTPEHWHGARMERLLGRTHAGKTGALVGAGTTAAGGVLGVHLVGREKKGVKKAFTFPPHRPGNIAGAKGLLAPGKKAIVRLGSGVSNKKQAVRRYGYRDGRNAGRNDVIGGGSADLFGQNSPRQRGYVQPGESTLLRAHNKQTSTKSGRTIGLREQAGEHRYADVWVGKSRTYGYMEERRNKKRAAQQVAGVGLVAHGGSRLQVGRQVDRGVKYAELKGHGDTAHKTVRVGRKVAHKTREVTGQAENVLRHVPGFGGTFDRIPAKYRPGLTVGAGALLAARATPSKDERFVATGSW